MRYCKICSNPELAKRVQNMLSEGISGYQIVKSIPEISDCNLRNHKKHMSSENDELMKQRQQLEGILDVGTGDFITDMRTELESLCKANTSLIRAAMTECSDGKFSRKLGEYTNTLTKLMSALDSVTGLKEKVSLDTAIDTVTRAGYEINQTEKATDSKSDNKVNVTPERFKEFKAWERNNGKA